MKWRIGGGGGVMEDRGGGRREMDPEGHDHVRWLWHGPLRRTVSAVATLGPCWGDGRPIRIAPGT